MSKRSRADQPSMLHKQLRRNRIVESDSKMTTEDGQQQQQQPPQIDVNNNNEYARALNGSIVHAPTTKTTDFLITLRDPDAWRAGKLTRRMLFDFFVTPFTSTPQARIAKRLVVAYECEPDRFNQKNQPLRMHSTPHFYVLVSLDDGWPKHEFRIHDGDAERELRRQFK